MILKFEKTNIEDLYLLKNFFHEDNRGSFLKTYNYDYYLKHGINFSPKEFYFSLNKKDVIRGMHYQSPPHDHIKLVTVINGSILDVVLDLRKKSDTYGQYFSTILNSESRKSIIIPRGCAHGFLSLEENSKVLYLQDSTYCKENDLGVLYNSFGFSWGIKYPKISDRDLSFVKFKDFNSPF